MSERMKRAVYIILPAVVAVLLFKLTLGKWDRIAGIYPYLNRIFSVIVLAWLSVKLLKIHEKTAGFSSLLKKIFIGCGILSVSVSVFLVIWYNYCFFPDDEDYLLKQADSVTYNGNSIERVQSDLVRELGKSIISSPLEKKDLDYLLNPELKSRDIYIDENPYGNNSRNNLKYATGKTFYYIYQKNCAVIKNHSSIRWTQKQSRSERFLEFDAVIPNIDSSSNFHGRVVVSYSLQGGKKVKLYEKNIGSEVKPDIEAFRFSNVFKAVLFYLKNPGRSVITDNTGWEKIKLAIPREKGSLEIRFESSEHDNAYFFAGTPRVFEAEKKPLKKELNIVYIIFDTIGQPHIDLYEYYKLFKEKGYDAAISEMGKNNVRTPEIDRYFDKSILFYNMTTEGETTRPSIVSLWTSQIYTKCRMPVFRNIVSIKNQKKFYEKEFATLGDELSKRGYLTKQIACNAQGHNVSGVGSDLGFDENHDYTMETSEYPANIKHIVKFLEENQKRKFFLYTHLNIPHTPKWIPSKYFINELWGSMFNIDAAKIRGNIRYADFNFKMIMDTLKKLKLDKNTLVVLTADHSMGEPFLFREKPGRQLSAAMKNGRESQSVATFHPNAIYARKGGQHLYSDYMKIPFIVIPPAGVVNGVKKNETYISTLDVAPTLLDITTGEKQKKFSGSSFKNLLEKPETEMKYTHEFIPMVGRFMRGFIYQGRYKYWWNITGIYKYDVKKGIKYIKQPEHLYDLENDYFNTKNLVSDEKYRDVLRRMRVLRMNSYRDYDEINFLQFPEFSKPGERLDVKIEAIGGEIVYPEVFGKNISYKRKSSGKLELAVRNDSANRIFSFETKPYRSRLKISIYSNGRPVNSDRIKIGVEKNNPFGKVISLNDPSDFFVSRITGRTGYESTDTEKGFVYFFRVPVNYWLEMNSDTKDINLSPGIKEVLRGWGYIQ